ncbi:MAG: response regulator [Armatimonadetes bacterium]|nr:response regulator [Armatimonadota bacterium]
MGDLPVILAVDDMPEHLRVLGGLLEQDYDFRIATSGPDALRAAASAPPDLVLLDTMMPDMDGYAVLARLKDDPATHAIPVIIVSSQDVAEAKLRAFREGAVDYITKPFAPDEVVARVRTHVELSRYRELRRAEAALRASEQRYRTIVETAMDGFWLTDHSGQLVAANAAYCRMSGYSEAELLAMGIDDLDMLEGPDDLRDHLNRVRTAGEDRFETQHRRADGTSFEVEVCAQHQRDTDQLVVFIRDISERRRAENERARLTAQLHQAQKMESIGLLAGGVAHDFNNMLAVILGEAEEAMDGVADTESVHDALEEIHLAALRSADLVSQLLAFARQQTVSPRVLDLNGAVPTMLKMLNRLLGEQTILRFEPAPGLWPCRIDPSQLDQILANLCLNARDAISGYGTIVIRTSNTSVEQAELPDGETVAAGDYVLISVTDDGSGMDDETLARIFEPFFTTKRMGHGTGLGMASVYGAARQNGGFVKVTSQVGVGTTVSVLLPRCVDADGPPNARLLEQAQGDHIGHRLDPSSDTGSGSGPAGAQNERRRSTESAPGLVASDPN